jgi:hypothetical protein
LPIKIKPYAMMTISRSICLCLITLLFGLSCSNNEKAASHSSNEKATSHSSDSGIKVLETTIERQNDETRSKNKFEVRLLLPVEKSGFLRVDEEQTSFTKVVDNSGGDLLEAHKKENEKNAGKWWHDPSMITDYGEHPFEPGIWTDITLEAAPALAANNVTLTGRIVLQYDTGKTQTDTLADLPIKMDLEENGIETKIGKVLIYGTGSVVTDNETYWSYNVEGDADMLMVEILGNNDTIKMKESTQGRGVTSTGFALHESTDLETVTLKIVYRIIRNEEILLGLTLNVD